VTDLHAQVRAAVLARLEVARAATPGPWRDEYSGETGNIVLAEDSHHAREWVARTQLHAAVFDAKHIAANDPNTAIRMCERDLRVLERHWLAVDQSSQVTVTSCDSCGIDWPCDEIRDLAVAYGIEVTT
jgi:hypothetical protein